jgi:carbon monoxide dehydrogenase subunit G
MGTYRTDFEIDASDEAVWAVLVDFESYGDWNPSLPSISGELREGSRYRLPWACQDDPISA